MTLNKSMDSLHGGYDISGRTVLCKIRNLDTIDTVMIKNTLRLEDEELARLILEGETHRVEFKSTLSAETKKRI